MEQCNYQLLSNQAIDPDSHYCCSHTRTAAYLAAFCTTCTSLTTLICYFVLVAVTSWKAQLLDDVYWGVQASYAAVLVAEMSVLCLSAMLTFAVHQEKAALIVPWLLGFIGSMSLEAIAIVYSNVLRDHVNSGFDYLFRAEVAAFLFKLFLNMVAIGAVVRFYRLLRKGYSWRTPETFEL